MLSTKSMDTSAQNDLAHRKAGGTASGDTGTLNQREHPSAALKNGTNLSLALLEGEVDRAVDRTTELPEIFEQFRRFARRFLQVRGLGRVPPPPQQIKGP